MDVNGKDEWARAPPPPSGPIWTRITNVLYNPKENTILGRTPKRWGIVVTFYLIFYAVLAALFAACMGGLFLTIDQKKPSYMLEQSLIGANPGLSTRPRPLKDVVLRYDVNNDTYLDFVQELDDFMQPFVGQSWYADMQACNANDSYGFPLTPCFFVKLNKIFGWVPAYYGVAELPADMPEDLRTHIESLDSAKVNQVWVSCTEQGNNATNIEYPWGRHLLGRYPFQNAKNHPSPVLAVKFNLPVNQLTTIRCRAWAKNIIHNKSMKEPSGYTAIQVYIKDTTE